MKSRSKKIIIALGIFLFLAALIFSLPKLLVLTIEYQQAASGTIQEFPVTVNPQKKVIVQNAEVDALLEKQDPPLTASISGAGGKAWDLFEWIAITISNAPWYQSIAGESGRFVVIAPGLRKEQVASAFGSMLGWNSKEEQKFITPQSATSSLPLPEGSFSPGVYFVSLGTTPSDAQALVNEEFSKDVLSHYSTSTQELVPLNEALTIASLIQRETITTDGMRLLSGIMWNRLFANMDLQIDSTLQYAKANSKAVGEWWPDVAPNDKYIKSAYNTYLHQGLPPTPIANPSVAAILAALNPIQTPCYYYFSDKNGAFHCSATYAEQVQLLKQYY